MTGSVIIIDCKNKDKKEIQRKAYLLGYKSCLGDSYYAKDWFRYLMISNSVFYLKELLPGEEPTHTYEEFMKLNEKDINND